MQSAYKRFITWKNVLATGVLVLLVYILNLWRDTIVWGWVTMLGNFISSQVSPIFLSVFQKHPYLLIFSVFILFNIILLAHAYVSSGTPHGLKIYDKKIDELVRMIIENNTGHDLIDCQAQVLDIVSLNKDGLKEPYEFMGLTPQLRWYSRGFPEGITTEIKDKTKGIFGIASLVKYKNEDEVASLDFPYLYELHKGKSKAEILFHGNTKQGDTTNYRLSAIIDYDGKSIKIEIWT